jgi:hypothetical protein
LRIFKTKWFDKFAQQNKIKDSSLRAAVICAEKGLMDADLGGNVIKQRVARMGQGKSGGYRTIIIYLRGEKAFFVHGFPKNDQNNLSSDEEKWFKNMAKQYLSLSEDTVSTLLFWGDFREVNTHE